VRNYSVPCALLSAAMLLHNPSTAVADSSGGTYTLTKQSIAGGGGAVAGAPNFTAVVTLGQAAAGAASGGSFQLISGFHPASEPTVVDALFQNGFEN